MHLTNMLAEEEGWKRCFNCQALVEHREACQHMTCRCGTQFCYVCGLRWRTCGCTMEQLYALKDAAETRREQRQFREQSEAEELREILAQIERLEREEAEAAEVLRQEQERREEERRQREIEERARQESLRRGEVEMKYQQLRQDLDSVNQLQRIMLDVRQDENARELSQEAHKNSDKLVEEQTAERAEFQSRFVDRLGAKELSLDTDYSSRLEKEKRIEQEYLLQLQRFWSGKPCGKDQIETAILLLRHQMDNRHKAWQRWRTEQIEMYQALLEEERTMREEVMYSVRQRLKDSYAQRKASLTRQINAEGKWFNAVVLERKGLLAEMELQETEGDADSLFAQDAETGVEHDADTGGVN